jgi:hypothetical protein
MIRPWPVQKAIYTRLVADSTLMGMVTSIVDEPDQNAGFPYILIGEMTATPDDVLDTTGGNHTCTIHFWDKDQPMSRVKQIMGRSGWVLHDAKLVLTATLPGNIGGGQVFTCRVEWQEAIRDVDTIHGLMRVRVGTFG